MLMLMLALRVAALAAAASSELKSVMGTNQRGLSTPELGPIIDIYLLDSRSISFASFVPWMTGLNVSLAGIGSSQLAVVSKCI